MLKRMNKEKQDKYNQLKEYVEQELANLATYFSNPHDMNTVGQILTLCHNRILRYARKTLVKTDKKNDKV
jgi:hypothetical protein